jgi:hypothetical protein
MEPAQAIGAAIQTSTASARGCCAARDEHNGKNNDRSGNRPKPQHAHLHNRCTEMISVEHSRRSY